MQNESAMWKEPATNTPALPAIKEHNPLELEEDANECLWNGASYLADRAGGELVCSSIARYIDRRLRLRASSLGQPDETIIVCWASLVGQNPIDFDVREDTPIRN